MGKCGTDALQVGFDGRLKLESHDSTITGRAGLLRAHPTVRPAVGRAKGSHAASTRQMGCFPFLEAKRYLYAIRLPANEVLQRKTEPLSMHIPHRPAGSRGVVSRFSLHQWHGGEP
jgi:hypothetical protein